MGRVELVQRVLAGTLSVVTRLQRKLLIHSLLIGAAATAFVVVADRLGMLTPLENWLYDRRVHWCQIFISKPTPTLVHLDIDDRALETISGWPWPRARWGELLDEIRIAGPKAVEMDVVFSEPQRVELIEQPTGPPTKLDHDAALASAIAQSGNVILPVSLKAGRSDAPLYAAMVAALDADPELTQADIEQRMRSRKLPDAEQPLDDLFLQARRDAVYERIKRELSHSPATLDDLRSRLLRKSGDLVSPLSRLVTEQYEKVLAHHELERFALIKPLSFPPTSPATINLSPLRIFSQFGAGAAFVDYPQFEDHVVRAVPMLIECDGKVFTQMGVALACQMLDIDPEAIRVQADEIILPRSPGRDIRIPVAPSRLSTNRQRLGMLMDVPWFGSRDWRTMYDPPGHNRIKQHLSLVAVWDACLTRQKIATNNAIADDAVRALLGVLDKAKLDKFMQSPLPDSDIAGRQKVVNATLYDAIDVMAMYAGMTPDELKSDPDGQRFIAAQRALSHWMEQTPALGEQLQQQRAVLRDALNGKAALIGWIATAAVADFIPTSLHDKAPGVVVHGVIYNAIVTGELWRRVPWGVSCALTIVLGMATALATGLIPPVRALLVAAVLFAGYAFVNGIVLFDFGNRIVGAAGPLTAIAAVWATCTVGRVVIETAERGRITRRFRNYVDPKLVNYVIEHPDKVSFSGESREMTVVFTDLAGFTSLSEQLGERIVPLLNELLDEMVPVIRDHHGGYVNKFLGDGIMFFYNAPLEDVNHAASAVATVLDLHKTIDRFNERLRERKLPTVFIRAGVSSGKMIVGDAGGAGTTDYTVLGDVVNLGSRLQSANKATGTLTLISDRTAELIGDRFHLRRVGRLEVVGKHEAVMTYEAVCRTSEATDAQRDLAKRSVEVVDAFSSRRFADVLSMLDGIDVTFGKSKFTALYRNLCEQYLREPPPGDFDGRIVLAEK